VSRGRAFRQHIGQPLLRCLNSGIHALAMCWRKGIGILPMPAARPVVPDSPPHRGPGQSSGPSWPALFRRAALGVFLRLHPPSCPRSKDVRDKCRCRSALARQLSFQCKASVHRGSELSRDSAVGRVKGLPVRARHLGRLV
jgi:hypothetical protein